MIVHEVAIQLVEAIHTDVMPLARQGDAELASQLHRASRSVALNVGEALGFRRGKRQRNHFDIALGSGRETMTALRLLVATQVVPGERSARSVALADRVNKMLWSLTRR